MGEQDGSTQDDFECKMKVSMETDKIGIIQEYARCRLNLEERKKKKGLDEEEVGRINEQLKFLRNEFLGWLEKSDASIKLKKEEARELALEYGVEAGNVEELLAEAKGFTIADVAIIDHHVLGDEGSVKLLDLCEEENKKSQKYDGECMVEDSISIIDLSDHSLVPKDLASNILVETAVPKKAELFEQAETFEAKNEMSGMDSNYYYLGEGIAMPEDSISLNLIGTNESPTAKVPGANLLDNQDFGEDLRLISDDDDCVASPQKGCVFFGFNLFCF